ncbi:MAG: hypothetical protein M3506_03990, partial [Chloroflexota bacterium]|nr:hypothetical protein [Chloroflexota bacterium]
LAPMIPAYTGVMLATSLLHIDRLDRGFQLYYWIFIYVFTPLAGVFFYFWHERRRATWAVESRPVTRSVRTAAVVAGGATAAYAVVCFGWPDTIVRLWPWTISPLMVRVFASWLFAFAGGLLWFGRERDWDRMRPVADMLLLSSGVLALMLVLHRGDVRWDTPAAWLFAAGIVGISLLGTAAIWLQRPGHSATRPNTRATR